MKKFNISTAQHAQGFQREALYNCIDCIATLEIDNVLEHRMTDADKRTHDFYMAMQGPALEMTIRGMRVDPVAREELQEKLKKEEKALTKRLQKHEQIAPIWNRMEKNTGACSSPSRKDGKHKWEPGVEDTPERKCLDCGCSRMKVRPFKPSSDDDLKKLFYELWKCKPQLNKDKKLSTDKEARLKLKEKYVRYADTIALIDEHADISKQLGFLQFKSDDGRFHASFNVGVTSTHRWSSNKDQYGRGGNAQNVTEKHRHIFVADPGKELCYADLKQAESNIIAHVAGDEEYINAHLVGDTHTYVCRLVWPEGISGQPWTGDIFSDKKIATSASPPWDDRPGHDYRFQSKAVQHGSNLGLTAFGLAIQKKIPVAAATEAQRRYFRAFPGIKGYQGFIRQTVEESRPIITPLGVRFKMFGRPWDEHTYKEGLAVIPQSTVGHIISIGLYRIWTELPEVELLAQVHDAILMQFPKGRYDLVYKAQELMTVPVEIEGLDGFKRTAIIPTEAAVGMNWGHYDKKKNLNPSGLHEIHFESETEWTID